MANEKISAMAKTTLLANDIIPKTPAAGGSNDLTTPADIQTLVLAGLVTAGGSIIAPVSHVAALPAAATEGTGAVRAVDDALTPAVGVAVSGGGAAHVLVLSTGAAWVVA